MSDAMKKFAWRWTRITNHKRDTADPGNAFMIYINDVTQPVPANGGKPTLEPLEAIEKKLGGAAASLYGHSVTRASGGPKVTITLATSQVVYAPRSSTGNGQEESFSVATLGQWLP